MKLSRIFSRYNHPDFFFVQIGANDGVRKDPIHHYILEYGWRGVLVEPLPDMFELLQANYKEQPGLFFENLAIAGHDGEVTFYQHENRPDVSGLSIKNPRQKRRGKMLPIQVKSMTLPTLIQKYKLARLDLLQMDAEGHDHEIVASIPFDVVKPRIIHYEHANLRPPELENCKKLLSDKGYVLREKRGNTLAYLP